jgi:Mor family transcriptional regulator
MGRKTKTFTEEQENEIIKDYLGGMFHKELLKKWALAHYKWREIKDRRGVGDRRPDYSHLPKDEVAADYSAGMRIPALMEKYKCTKDAIYDITKPLKVESPFWVRRGSSVEKRILELHALGWPALPIGREVGKSQCCVIGCLERNGLKADNHLAVPLDEHDVVCARYLAGESSEDIAKTYQTAGCVIRNVLEKNGIARRGMSEARQIYSINQDYFDVIDSVEKAYIIGYFYADACNKTYDRTVSMGLSIVDEEILHKIKKWMGTEDRPLRYFQHETKSGEIKDYVELNIYNKKISEKLEEIGIVRAKSYVEILDLPKGIPYSLIRHFLRGLIDGDGCIFTANTAEFNLDCSVMGNPVLLGKLADHIHKEIGYLPTIREANLIENTKCRSRNMYVAGNRNCVKFLQWLYKDHNGARLERKYQKYKSVISDYFSRIKGSEDLAEYNYVH